MGEAGTRYDVNFGDVRDAQIVIGDHTTVVTPDGVKVVRIVGDEGRPKLRPAPSAAPPVPRRPLIGRGAELELARSAAPGWPLELLGEEGIGKTSVLKQAAADAPEGPVVYAVARRRSLDDLQAMLFRAFWEADERFVPAPDQMPSYLSGREALVALDDVGLDRDDLGVLLDTAPRCTFVLTSPKRTVWDAGAARELGGLSPEESVELIERELGRSLTASERAAVEAAGGRPQTLIELAAHVLDRSASLEELAGGAPPPEPGTASLRVLGVLGTLSGAAVGTEHLTALAGGGDVQALLDRLERSGWVKSDSPRYRLAQRLAHLHDPAFVAPLVEHFAAWARSADATPEAVAEEVEAIEGLLEQTVRGGRQELTLTLARATESKLATAGLLGSWRRVLEAGLRASALPADEAYMLHQLGSRAIGVHDSAAREQLTAALEIRERIGDEQGAELTRHNLAQLDGGPGNGRGPRRPRLGPLLGGLGLAAALGVAVGILLHEDTDDPRPAGVTTATRPQRGHDPTIAISVPTPNTRYPPDTAERVAYVCRAASDTELEDCSAEITPGVGPVANGDPLPAKEGSYTLVVRARDGRGRTSRTPVEFHVLGGGKTDDTPDDELPDTDEGKTDESPGITETGPDDIIK